MQKPANFHGYTAGVQHDCAARKHTCRKIMLSVPVPQGCDVAMCPGVVLVAGLLCLAWYLCVSLPMLLLLPIHISMFFLFSCMSCLCVCVYTDCTLLLLLVCIWNRLCVCQLFRRLDLVLSVQMRGLRWHSLTDPMLGCHATCLPLASGYFYVDPSPKHSLHH